MIAVDKREGKKRGLDGMQSPTIFILVGGHTIGHAKFLVIDCIESQAGVQVAEPGL